MENNQELKNMKIYHQKIARDSKTNKVTKYMGEDSRPFVNSNIIMVSDGLGGRGGYPHYTANLEMLNKEKFLEMVKTVLIPNETEEEIVEESEDEDIENITVRNYESDMMNFLEENFFELFEMADEIKENPLKMRTSGYFASRLLTASFLYAVGQSNYIDLFKSFFHNKEQLNQAAEQVKNIMLETLQKLADVLGLKNDSKTKGNYLLPATITATLLYENEDTVDAIYLWAGDTRGYVWTEKKGLQQVTKDHEEGETMYNLFKLDSTPNDPKEHSTKLPVENDGFIPTLEVKYIQFKKPCFIFNTSDGIYKCHNFGSPLDLEYTLIEPFLRLESIEEVEKELDRIYGLCGLHDDSNTLAGKFFGYKDYQDFVKAIKKRVENIDKLYVSQMPNIWSKDCISDVRIAEMNYSKGIRKAVPLFRNDPFVIEYVKEQIKKQNFGNYGALALEEKNELKNIQKRIDFVTDKIKSIIVENWLDICGENSAIKDELEKSEKVLQQINEEYQKDLVETMQQYEKLLEQLKDKISNIYNIEDLLSTSGIDSSTEQVLRKIEKLNDKLRDLYSESELVKQYNRKKASKNKINVLETCSEEIDNFVEQLLDITLNTNSEEACAHLTFDTKKLKELLNEYIKLQKDLFEEENDGDKVDIPNSLIDKYWSINSEKVVKYIWDNEKEKLLPETITSVNELLLSLQEKVKEEKEILNHRQKIYDQYEIIYNEYLNEITEEEKLNNESKKIDEKIKSL